MVRRLIHRWLLRPIMRMLTGIRVEGELPSRGPAIVVANHNSHVDTALLLAAFDNRAIPVAQPVAAGEYFCRNPLLSWFSRRIIGVLPIARGENREAALASMAAALEDGRILIVFPEGTRGDPGVLGLFKQGVSLLAADFPNVPVVPVWIAGTHRVLPRGKRIPVPHRCRILVGPAIRRWTGDAVVDSMRLRRAVAGLGRVA